MLGLKVLVIIALLIYRGKGGGQFLNERTWVGRTRWIANYPYHALELWVPRRYAACAQWRILPPFSSCSLSQRSIRLEPGSLAYQVGVERTVDACMSMARYRIPLSLQ